MAFNIVHNNSDNPVYLKDESSSGSFALAPGETQAGSFDGIYVPGRPNEVYKIQDGQSAWVSNSGVRRTPDIPGFEAGGWKGEPWYSGRPEWSGFISNSICYSGFFRNQGAMLRHQVNEELERQKEV